MDAKQARQLLERYFNGETRLEEEAQLRSFFAQEKVPADLRPYQPLFQFFGQEQTRTTSTRFNQQLAQQAARLPVVQGRRRQLSPIFQRLAVAALFVLAVGWWHYQSPAPPVNRATAAIDWSKYEPQNEEEAFRVYQSAMRKTARALQRSVQMATTELEGVKKLVQPLQ
ncbi:MAG: hypothetical protein DA408_06060 [Bacteroidetes bacterium]|nr:MAG: hypothetical protein C7N36_09565 [Bacteroidota bacterium]PTM13695.1 MAG: hypothetical protein DA408_06060 [Bacteroidota bacterium]